MLARLHSQPIKYRIRERQPITERIQGISLKCRLSYLQFDFFTEIHCNLPIAN